MDSLTEFLYARPSFLEGVARILDFGNTLTEYNRCPTGAQADRLALASDWATIGTDLRAAMSAYAQTLAAERRTAENKHEHAARAHAHATEF